MAALAGLAEGVSGISPIARNRARQRALAALRFSLRSHVSGDGRCTDGTPWGHTWISPLGIERMMYGVRFLLSDLTDEDRTALRRVIAGEADWIATRIERGPHRGVVADRWARSGKNVPESNAWNGALLWRAASLYPNHPHSAQWRAKAHRFLLNAVSVPTDAEDERLFEGRPIKDWHIGANFFPNFALDHHGYLNVGYMIICLSNAAMLHFDLIALGMTPPESLYHHQADLWRVARRFVFSDARLARIGGDTRVRYAYCQEYLLPVLVFAAAQLGDSHAPFLLAEQLRLIDQEARHNEDGGFYSKRLATLAESNPYYYTRLESDRACALAMAAAYIAQWQGYLGAPERMGLDARIEAREATQAEFEASVAGSWCEPEHGAVLHRSPTRLASFAWRAHALGQGLCQPPDDGHLAEWPQNLGGFVRFVGDEGRVAGVHTGHRKLESYTVEPFDGGFLTCGSIFEGVNVAMAEGWHGDVSARHQIAFAALPDSHTVIGLEHCRTANHRTYVAEVKGMHLNLPNDLYNHFRRRITTRRGELTIESPGPEDHIIHLGEPWANVEGRIGIVGLYGAREIAVHQTTTRRGGPYESLYVDEICWHCEVETAAVDPGKTVLDVGWAVLSGIDVERTQRFAQLALTAPTSGHPQVRGVRVKGFDGVQYVVLANFAGQAEEYPVIGLLSGAHRAQNLVSGQSVSSVDKPLTLEPGTAYAFAVEK